jgi:tetrahydromethanopterin S-methyltransferase subunit G
MKNEGICDVTVGDLFLELKKLKEEVFILRQDLDEVNKRLDDIDRKEEDKRKE